MTGTVGRTLVQIRLLQFGVQAAPPIKDSGNDLIAVCGHEFRGVGAYHHNRGITSLIPVGSYTFLRSYLLSVRDRDVHLDQSRIFLIPQSEVASASTDCASLGVFEFSPQQVEALFGSVSLEAPTTSIAPAGNIGKI